MKEVIEMGWADLNKAYQEQGLVLVLGAGVSSRSNFPSWPDLLKNISSRVTKHGDRFVDELLNKRYSYPAIASILISYCKDRDHFVDEVRRALYQNFSYSGRRLPREQRGTFAREVFETNETLSAIAALCVISHDGEAYYGPNPLIHAIVNFNIDSVFRAYVHARYPGPKKDKTQALHRPKGAPTERERIVRTIERASKSPRLGKISVYHIHGFLRFDDTADDPTEEAPDRVVLTEQEYFDFFDDPTSLFNYTLLYLLREYACLFIGLSMDDENLRRLLWYSRRDRLQAYRDEGVEQTEKARKLRHFAILQRTDSSGLDEARKRSLTPLGVCALWTKDFKDIPSRFRDLYESGGGLWESVFCWQDMWSSS